jgi:hypothetical protein
MSETLQHYTDLTLDVSLQQLMQKASLVCAVGRAMGGQARRASPAHTVYVLDADGFVLRVVR